MNKVWFTADQHFFHKNIIEYEDGPFRDVEHMNAEMLWLWNEVVAPEDDVYVLGDLCFGPTHKSVEIVRALNGRKFLVIGNHDNKSRKYFAQFEWVRKMHTLRLNGYKLILCHYPMCSWESEEEGSIHLHGHSHTKGSRYGLSVEFHRHRANGGKEPFSRGFRCNVGVDWWRYQPISLDEIIEESEKVPSWRWS